MAQGCKNPRPESEAYMIIKTTGLVLRLDPFSKTSQVITWLTPDHGRTVTLAKGAKRVKSNLVGQYDCFYTCELLFIEAGTALYTS